MNPISFGKLQKGSKILLVGVTNDFYMIYSTLKAFGTNNYLFTSYDPTSEYTEDVIFDYDDNGVFLKTPDGKYLNNSFNRTNNKTYHLLKTDLNIDKNVYYSGIYYEFLNNNLLYVNVAGSSVPPFSSSPQPTERKITNVILQMIPVTIFENIQGVELESSPIIGTPSQCILAANYKSLLTDIMIDHYNEIYTNKIYTSNIDCALIQFPQYCLIDQYCGECYGLCTDLTNTCVYNTYIESFSCNPNERPPTTTPIPTPSSSLPIPSVPPSGPPSSTPSSTPIDSEEKLSPLWILLIIFIIILVCIWKSVV